MLLPGASVAGKAPASAVKLLLDVLNCAISSGEAPGFIMETLRNTGCPTFTSPKSTVAGFTTSAGVDDENGLLSAPQPESENINIRLAAPSVIADPVFLTSNFGFVSKSWSRPVVLFDPMERNNKLRNSYISSPVPMELAFKSANAAGLHQKGEMYRLPWLTISRIDPVRRPVQVTIVTNGVCMDYLCTTSATCCKICGWLD